MIIPITRSQIFNGNMNEVGYVILDDEFTDDLYDNMAVITLMPNIQVVDGKQTITSYRMIPGKKD